MERKSQNVVVKQITTKQSTITAPPTPDQIVVAMKLAIKQVRQMNHAERVQSLKEAGILNTAGKLSACYR